LSDLKCIRNVGLGHDAEYHERLLTGVELERRKADYVGDPLWVLKSRAVESLGWLLTHSPMRFTPQTACRKADAQRLSAMTHGQAAASARLLASHEF